MPTQVRILPLPLIKTRVPAAVELNIHTVVHSLENGLPGLPWPARAAEQGVTVTSAREPAIAHPQAMPQTAADVAWRPLSIVMVGMFMAILDSFIVVVAGPALQADLGASAGDLQWILAGYQLSY